MKNIHSLFKVHTADITLFWAPGSGGVRTYLQAKREWMKRLPGCAHTLLVPAIVAESGPGLRTLPAPPILFSNGYRFPLRIEPWVEQLCDLQPNLIEAGDPYRLAWAALQAGSKLDVPVVAFFHSDLIRVVNKRFGGWADPWIGRYLNKLYNRCDRVLAPSQVMADRLTALGVERVAVQPLGVDTKQFNPGYRDPAVREELGLADNTRLLIFAGRNSREKNLPVLLDAMQQLGSGYHLRLAGSNMPPHLPANVSRTDGFLDHAQLARLLASSDALVHAGDIETFGLVVLEAMACGVPVVGVNAGAVPELVTPHTGLLAEPQSADSLARTIRALFAEDYRAMGNCARQHVVAHYDWQSVLPALWRHYQELIHGQMPVSPSSLRSHHA